MVIHFRHIFMAVLSLFSLFCHAQKNTPDVNHQDYWIDKYLSVSFPLQRVEINSPFGIRKDPFTGKEKEHCGLDFLIMSFQVQATVFFFLAGEWISFSVGCAEKSHKSFQIFQIFFHLYLFILFV